MKDLFIQWLEDLNEEKYNDLNCMKYEAMINPSGIIGEFCRNRVEELTEKEEEDLRFMRRIRNNPDYMRAILS